MVCPGRTTNPRSSRNEPGTCLAASDSAPAPGTTKTWLAIPSLRNRRSDRCRSAGVAAEAVRQVPLVTTRTCLSGIVSGAVVRSGFTICLTPSWTPVHGGVPISTSGCSVTIWLGLLGASGAPRAGTTHTIDRRIDRIPASSVLVMTSPLSHSVRSRDRAHGSTRSFPAAEAATRSGADRQACPRTLVKQGRAVYAQPDRRTFMKRTALVTLVAVVLTLGPRLAGAQMAACAGDAERLCHGMRPGGGRIIGCLRGN